LNSERVVTSLDLDEGSGANVNGKFLMTVIVGDPPRELRAWFSDNPPGVGVATAGNLEVLPSFTGEIYGTFKIVRYTEMRHDRFVTRVVLHELDYLEHALSPYLTVLRIPLRRNSVHHDSIATQALTRA